MPIKTVEPPTRAAGRRARLSEEDLKELAKLLKTDWASDGEATKSRSAAYQRAQAAVKLLGLGKDAIKSTVYPVDESDESKGFYWAIRERPKGERPRGRRANGSVPVEPTAA